MKQPIVTFLQNESFYQSGTLPEERNYTFLADIPEKIYDTDQLYEPYIEKVVYYIEKTKKSMFFGSIVEKYEIVCMMNMPGIPATTSIEGSGSDTNTKVNSTTTFIDGTNSIIEEFNEEAQSQLIDNIACQNFIQKNKHTFYLESGRNYKIQIAYQDKLGKLSPRSKPKNLTTYPPSIKSLKTTYFHYKTVIEIETYKGYFDQLHYENIEDSIQGIPLVWKGNITEAKFTHDRTRYTIAFSRKDSRGNEIQGLKVNTNYPINFWLEFEGEISEKKKAYVRIIEKTYRCTNYTKEREIDFEQLKKTGHEAG